MAANETVDRQYLSMMCRQFAGMLESGMDLLRIIEVLREQVDSASFREMLDSVKKDVRLGRLLSTALGRFPEMFSPFFIGMVRQGERDDSLVEVLIRLADHLEQSTDLTAEYVEESAGRFEIHYLIDRIWILLFWMFISVAAVAIGVAMLWYATLREIVPQGSLGPNVCLLIGVFLLTSALLFSRFKPLRHQTCLFCGRKKEQVERLVIGIGAAICDHCVRQQHDLLPAPARSEVFSESQPPKPQSPSESSILEEVEVDIEENEIEIVTEQSYPYQ
ncbi:MAG: hypothetical protein AUJ92_12180 [Armatimonadetes bacterium CG2_30_59_28]|nr:hypothetical protein [Armatimonadota bacterium]OIO93553.1 MAG: hypothetical protein AUJ92_12180 [Armatimonadetes bacterium CG2_30_59_28]